MSEITTKKIEKMIYEIRGHKVMLDCDWAELYESEIKMLKRAVRRNIERFPGDFMFQITKEEFEILRFQVMEGEDTCHMCLQNLVW